MTAHFSNSTKRIKARREQVFAELYRRCFPAVARWVKRRGGQQADAQDVFQDSLIVFYEKAVNGQLQDCRNEEAYLLGIAKKLWLKKCNREDRFAELDPQEQNIAIPLDFYQQTKSQGRLLRFLEVAGKKCMEVLRAFYYHHTSLPEIAEKFGFSNTRSATVQKYKCLEKIRKEVKTKQLSYEEIVE